MSDTTRIRATFNDDVLEVDSTELAALKAQGLVAEVLDTPADVALTSPAKATAATAAPTEGTATS